MNGVFHASDPGDALAVAMERRQDEALADLPAGLADLPREAVVLRPHNLVGIEALWTLVRDDEGGQPDGAEDGAARGPLPDVG